jgi:hypothetical protein
VEKFRVRCPPHKVVFGHELIELGSGEHVISAFDEVDKEEDAPFPVVQVHRAGGRLVWHGLQQQNASWHFDPSCSHSLANVEEDFDDVLDACVFAQANVVTCKQRLKSYRTSAS